LTPWQGIAVVVIAVAHVVGGVTAFGSSLLSASVLVAIGGVDELAGLVPVLALCGLVQAGMIARGGLGQLRWREVAYILVWMGAGLPLGRWFALAVDPRLVRAALGALLLLGGVAPWLISQDKRRKLPTILRGAVLVLAGCVHGGFASGGTVLIPYMRLTHTQKERFRATLAAIWVALNAGLLAMLAGRLFLHESFGEAVRHVGSQAPFGLLACLGAVVATWLGQAIAKRLNEKRFAQVVAGAMVLAGALYLVRPLLR
jgi:hypothetical protein